MNKKRATQILRYCIAITQGTALHTSFHNALYILIGFKEDLEKNGFWWQASRVNNWIHRFQGNRGFLQTREASLTTQDEGGHS
jgi:hypothetical protein